MRHCNYLLGLFTLLLFTTNFSRAFDPQDSSAVSAHLRKDISFEFGAEPSHAYLDPAQILRVLVWNVHKIEDPNLIRDFFNFSERASFVLFQEMIDEPAPLQQIAIRNLNLGWTMARAWTDSAGTSTGVATGSSIKPQISSAQLSRVTEPITNTPKSALFSIFAIEGRQESLLVVNVHAINFVTLANFRSHINQIFIEIKKHKGPLILAGDFNTWNSERLEYLQRKCRMYNLKQLDIPEPRTFFTLDHAFVRGLEPIYIFNLGSVETSDHAPLLFDLKLLPE